METYKDISNIKKDIALSFTPLTCREQCEEIGLHKNLQSEMMWFLGYTTGQLGCCKRPHDMRKPRQHLLQLDMDTYGKTK